MDVTSGQSINSLDLHRTGTNRASYQVAINCYDRLVRDLTRERDMASILIIHDLGLAAEYCDRLAIMKDGEIVETGASAALFAALALPYTGKLEDATPRPVATLRDLLPLEARTPLAPHAAGARPLIEVCDLVKTRPSKSGTMHAVEGISFRICEGRSVGLVGESGCGKSTTSSMLVRLLDPTSGEIVEQGPAARITDTPEHPYARTLLAAAPKPPAARTALQPAVVTAAAE